MGELPDAAWLAGLDGVAAWTSAINADGTLRHGARVAEATGLLDLSTWPPGSRVILRKEQPHPGAQLSFLDVDSHRITGSPRSSANTPHGVVPGQLAGLDLRHRQHAQVEDRIQQAKATGMRNFSCHSFTSNQAWLEIVLSAIDLIAWSKLIGFKEQPGLARCEVAAYRYRVPHVAARIRRSGRRTRLRIDRTWPWAKHIPAAWQHIRAAFT